MRKPLLLLTALFISQAAFAAPTGKPFELWPSSPGAEPAPYTKAAPEYDAQGMPWKFKGGQVVDVKLDAGKVLAPVTPYHFGGNVAWWDHHEWLMSDAILERARQSGIRFWRWPGGSSSDNYHWDGDFKGHEKESGGGDATRMTQPWAVSNDDFIEFCQKTGSEAIVTANYGMARYFSVKKAADLASRWVKYFNGKGFKVRYWEVGNENYGPWEEGTKMEGKPQLGGDEYGKDFREIARAIRKADPDVFVGAVAVDQDNGEDWTGFRWWMKKLLPEVKTAADYLILHQYFLWPFDQSNNYTNPSHEAFLGNLYKLGDAYRNVQTMMGKYMGDVPALPVVLTEFNLVNAAPQETIQLLNGLFTAQVLGEQIKAGYVCSNHWDWRNGLDAKLGGDHALLAVDDPSVPDGTPRPAYYAYVLYNRAFGDKMVEASSSDTKVKVYASRFSGGGLGLILTNETEKARTVHLEITGAETNGQFLGWVLTGKDLGAKQVTFNGEEGPENGGGPFPVDSLAPYRGSFDAKKVPSINVPPYSVCGVVLY